MRRFRTATLDGNQQDRPKRLRREVFPAGIKELHSPNPEESTADIVFVHGLSGDRETTWTAKDATEPWPKTLLPSLLSKAQVLTFGYDSHVADWWGGVSQNRTRNHAWNLLTTLASYREGDGTNDRPVMFVCHSLGGLVCEDTLVTSKQQEERPDLQNIYRSARGIVFLGTPHHGAGLAKWAELTARSIDLIKSTNPDIVEVLKRDSEVLARIQDSFHALVMARSKGGQPIEIACFYEELPMDGVGVIVAKDSAILPGYRQIGIRGNHSDMTKFSQPDDPGLLAIYGELRRWIRDLEASERSEVPRLLPQSDSNERYGSGRPIPGDGNRQYITSGGTQNIVSGNYFQAGATQNFGTITTTGERT